MDKSKMATQGTVIHYDPQKGENRMSRPVESFHSEWCCCEECRKDGNKSLDETLEPTDDGPDLCCC